MKHQIDGHTKLLGVIGDPIEHTLSPVIHNTLNEILGRNCVYVPFHVKETGLRSAVLGAFDLNVFGMNVTVPHKNAVMDVLQEVDEVAKAIGAVNTLVRSENGYKGYNTDMEGLQRALHSDGISLKNRTVVLLGAGGAAKAVAYMCIQEQAKAVYILNRTLEKAKAIAASMNEWFHCNVMQAMTLEEAGSLPQEPWIVFQCTSLGLPPHTDAVVIDDRMFYQNVEIGVDLIYNPAETRFMHLVKEAGGRAYNGLKMLLYQGIIAYELWNEVSVTEQQAETVYDRLYETLHGTGDNLVLIGFMGCGKTTIGRELERQYGYAFLDTDAYIERRVGKSISRVFEEDGESYFRELETAVLQEMIRTASHCVIATGGGMPMRRENIRLLRELGHVCYLTVSEQGVWERLKDSHDRPLLECEDPRARIRDLLNEREPVYRQAAHVIVQTENRKPEEIAEIIYQNRTGCESNESISSERTKY